MSTTAISPPILSSTPSARASCPRQKVYPEGRSAAPKPQSSSKKTIKRLITGSTDSRRTRQESMFPLFPSQGSKPTMLGSKHARHKASKASRHPSKYTHHKTHESTRLPNGRHTIPNQRECTQWWPSPVPLNNVLSAEPSHDQLLTNASGQERSPDVLSMITTTREMAIKKRRRSPHENFTGSAITVKRRRPKYSELAQHASLVSWQRRSIASWLLKATRPSSQSSRKSATTSLDQSCPMTSVVVPILFIVTSGDTCRTRAAPNRAFWAPLFPSVSKVQRLATA